MKKYKFNKPETEWKKKLSVEEFKILREKGTEIPFSGKYNLSLIHISEPTRPY